MKTKDILMIIFIFISLLLLVASIYFYLFRTDSKYEEVSNKINFIKVEYSSIENIIYYQKTTDITSEREVLTLVAKKMKNMEQYNTHQYIFLRKLASFDGEEIYRMAQIQDGIVLNNTEFNVYFKPTTQTFYTVGVSSSRI